MADIYLGILLIYAFSAALLLTGFKLARTSPHWVTIGLMLVTLTLLLYSSTRGRDRLQLAQALPVSNLVVIGDMLPAEGALLLGLSWPLIAGGARRKAVVIVPLLLAMTYQANWPLFAKGPMVGDKWREGVCRQTSAVTCVPAAAATLLQYYGIAATESEMADLCLTTPRGTSMLGLFRGLKIKTEGTPWEVMPFVGTREDLRKLGVGPVILSVGIDPTSKADRQYQQENGWIPGVNHTVVLYGFLADGKIDIGDPAVGRETWSANDLDLLWRGEGIYLARSAE